MHATAPWGFHPITPLPQEVVFLFILLSLIDELNFYGNVTAEFNGIQKRYLGGLEMSVLDPEKNANCYFLYIRDNKAVPKGTWSLWHYLLVALVIVAAVAIKHM